MLLIPVVELKDGLCVHTVHGEFEDTICAEEPLRVAERFAEAGVKALHVVDVNATLTGVPDNAHVIELLVQRFPKLAIQVAAGIKNEDLIPIYLDSGARYVVLSPKLARNSARVGELTSEFPDSLLAAIDARDGRCGEGTVEQIAADLVQEGVTGLVYTDIPSTPPVNGARLTSTLRLADRAGVPVIGNGLLRSSEDVEGLKSRAAAGLHGVMVGQGTLDSMDLAALLKAVEASKKTKPK